MIQAGRSDEKMMGTCFVRDVCNPVGVTSGGPGSCARPALQGFDCRGGVLAQERLSLPQGCRKQFAEFRFCLHRLFE